MIALAWHELAAIVAIVALVALAVGGTLPEKYRSGAWVVVGFLASVLTLGFARRFFGPVRKTSATDSDSNDIGATLAYESKSDALQAIVESRENEILTENAHKLDPGDHPDDRPGDLAKLDEWAANGRE